MSAVTPDRMGTTTPLTRRAPQGGEAAPGEYRGVLLQAWEDPGAFDANRVEALGIQAQEPQDRGCDLPRRDRLIDEVGTHDRGRVDHQRDVAILRVGVTGAQSAPPASAAAPSAPSLKRPDI